MAFKKMSFFRYAGGKTKLKTEIIKCIFDQIENTNNIQYREPFFGGGSIGLHLLFDNSKFNNYWINDKDIGISCIWTSVILYPEEFKKLVINFIPSVDWFYKIKSELLNLNIMPTTKNEIINIGFKKLAIHQISYSGLGTKSGGPLGGEEQKSNYKIDCRWSPEYICKKIDNLNKYFKNINIKNNSCTCLDFSNLINDDTEKSFIYLDPPYYIKGNDLYQHGFTENDHIRLSIDLKNTKHSWVLSYDDCPEIKNLYSWAEIKPLNVNYSITALKDKNTGERLSRNKNELLIYRKK